MEDSLMRDTASVSSLPIGGGGLAQGQPWFPLWGRAPRDLAESGLSMGLIDRSDGRLQVDRKGASRGRAYFTDLYHTLINLPTAMFFGIFFLIQLLFYFIFAIVYVTQGDCISQISGQFVRAFWFSFSTGAVLGYSSMVPAPSCFDTNFTIMVQVHVTVLLNYALFGVFFMRFSHAGVRAATLRFSDKITLFSDGGVMRLAFRIANLRKHTVTQPLVRLLLCVKRPVSVAWRSEEWTDETDLDWVFESLGLEDAESGASGLSVSLHLPCTITHVIRPGSPLFGLTPADMAAPFRDMSLLVVLDGVDTPTSEVFHASQSYSPSDILQGRRFVPCVSRNIATGRLAVDLSRLNVTEDWAAWQASHARRVAQATII